MQELLTHPAVQGGVAPFIVALAAAELFRRLRLSGLALIAGFAVTVYMVGGFSFEPLTATRKIVLLGLASAVLGLALMRLRAEWVRALLAVAGGTAAIWVAQRILQQQPPAAILLWGVGCVLYVGWLAYWMDRLDEDSLRAGSAGLGLGLGTGAAALFGGSALLGQYGLALGAAAGAFLLLQMLTNSTLPGGRAFTLPLALVAGTSACLAVLTTELPWYALPVLAVIPLAARIPLPAKAVWLQAVLLSVVTVACAAIALYLTWRVAGAPPV